jgi:hypothetical protein
MQLSIHPCTQAYDAIWLNSNCETDVTKLRVCRIKSLSAQCGYFVRTKKLVLKEVLN